MAGTLYCVLNERNYIVNYIVNEYKQGLYCIAPLELRNYFSASASAGQHHEIIFLTDNILLFIAATHHPYY